MSRLKINLQYLKKVGQLLVSIGIPFVAGGLGSLVTIPNISSWYIGLNKPPLLPPNQVFGPVWTTLYLLMGIALFLVWKQVEKTRGIKAFDAFGLQLLLNVIWSVVFFGLHLPWLGAVVILGLIAAIIWTMIEFKKHSRGAMWLLVPYLAWVCFATYLTFGVAVLN